MRSQAGWCGRGGGCGGARRAFTLVELLVVVSIIALLIAILLPSLKKARAQAKVVKCSANERQVGQALSVYLAEYGGAYPPSYVYPVNAAGGWSLRDDGQDLGHAAGYVHWSYFLYSSGKINAEAFECPDFPNGGAPRTNPGLRPGDREPGQVDQNNDPNANELEDKQAPRISYATNAAIVPRNKFTPALSDGPRVNVLVPEARITRAGNTILATEYLNNWKALGINQGNGVLVKAHRPINVFYHIGSGCNEYKAPVDAAGFMYGLNTAEGQKTYGLLPLAQLRDMVNVLDYTSGIPQINAVGRHHPGGDARYGGTANFLFCDGHVEALTPLDSMRWRKWGDRYHALTGKNEVLNMTPARVP